MLARTATTALAVALVAASAVGVIRVRQLESVSRDRSQSSHDVTTRTALGTAAQPPRDNAKSAAPDSVDLRSRTEADVEAHEPDAFERLPAVTFHNRNSKQSLTIKLYGQAGQIDDTVAAELDSLLADTRDPKQPKTAPIDRRLLQLLYRTAYHFDTLSIEVTSAFRAPGRKREGLHALGRAIDFAIVGVKAEELASYLRKQPRVGVGIYTHRRTRFVHLDVREQSYHWLDASPPGRTWRGMSIGDRSLAARDAAYRKEDDWPEALLIPRNE
jgi:uncharacterized protein YcbK (DUF882 family)